VYPRLSAIERQRRWSHLSFLHDSLSRAASFGQRQPQLPSVLHRSNSSGWLGVDPSQPNGLSVLLDTRRSLRFSVTQRPPIKTASRGSSRSHYDSRKVKRYERWASSDRLGFNR
jgi:hypothetical protein